MTSKGTVPPPAPLSSLTLHIYDLFCWEGTCERPGLDDEHGVHEKMKSEVQHELLTEERLREVNKWVWASERERESFINNE